MAKKLGKALIFTAVASTLVAGGIALYNKYKVSTDDFDDDFLDFDDDDENDEAEKENEKEGSSTAEREYVSIPRDENASANEFSFDDFKETDKTEEAKAEEEDVSAEKKADEDDPYKVEVKVKIAGDFDDTDDTEDFDDLTSSQDEL